MCNSPRFTYRAGIKVHMSTELLECTQSVNQMMNWIRFNKRCSFMVMRDWIWVSSAQRYLEAERRRIALHPLPFSLSLPIFITLARYLCFTSLSFFFRFQLANPPRPRYHYPAPPYRFESSLNVYTLAPRYSGIGQTVSGAASTGDIHALAPQVPEGFCYHQDGIMGQSWGVLCKNSTFNQSSVVQKGQKYIVRGERAREGETLFLQ